MLYVLAPEKATQLLDNVNLHHHDATTAEKYRNRRDDASILGLRQILTVGFSNNQRTIPICTIILAQIQAINSGPMVSPEYTEAAMVHEVTIEKLAIEAQQEPLSRT